MLLTPSDTKPTQLFTNPTQKDWFQYVRRVHATAINFPCIITLLLPRVMKFSKRIMFEVKSQDQLDKLSSAEYNLILKILNLKRLFT